MKYSPADIETRWQRFWAENKTFRTPNPGDAGFDAARPKYYVLAMFPYPSGAGMHMGHALNYTSTDIAARYRRMRGYNVLHPIGFDAFGLPAEQYAVETGTHPAVTTQKNIDNITAQFEKLGLAFDWDRCVSTTDPAYYRWTQWIFLQLYHSYFDPIEQKARPISELIRKLEGEDYYINLNGELVASGFDEDLEAITGGRIGVHKWYELEPDQQRRLLDEYRLAYMDDVEVNWCPGLGTVLANEEVTNDGKSERGNFPVYKRPLRQWMLRITAYADRLADDLDLVDWPEPIKLLQRNWIGRSDGAEVDFPILRAAASPSPDSGETSDDSSGDRDVVAVLPGTGVNIPSGVTGVPGGIAMTMSVHRDRHPDKPPRRFRDGDADVLDENLTVFTTRPDTLFGATYMVLAPEHPLVDDITTPAQRGAVKEYREAAAQKTDLERQADDAKAKTGVSTGAYAINPVNGELLPIWIADYVMMGYGTGAIMAVPAHDDRDFEFASAHALPIRDVVYSPPMAMIAAFCERYDATQYDDEQGKRMLLDFVGLCTNQGRTDYDTVYKTIIERRGKGGEDPGISARGSISMLWEDTIDGLTREGFLPLVDAASHGHLIERLGDAMTDDGVAVNCENDEISLNGKSTPDAKAAMIEWLSGSGLGKAKTQYKLRDWLFSRQRYWGEPFPKLHGPDEAIVPVGEDELPVELPEMTDFKPEAIDDPNAPPRPPLGRAPESWRQIERDGVVHQRELNTMPQWAGSCWYYLRFLDPENADRFVGEGIERYWMGEAADVNPRRDRDTDGLTSAASGGVDLYVGGVEHAVLHLLYARFWHKVLYDLGHVSTPEPFGKLFNQGYIQAHYYEDARGVRVPADEVEHKDGKHYYQGQEVTEHFGKMGKSLKNSVVPDEVIKEYGSDTLRLFLMYLGPLDQSKLWNPQDIVGVHRFLQRLWRNVYDPESGALLITDDPAGESLKRKLHQTIKRATDAMDGLSFNVAIAALIELNNAVVALEKKPREVVEPLVRMLAPLAPHIAEELWEALGHAPSVADADWPAYDEAVLVEDQIELPVQINGKLRGRITVPANADQAAVEAVAKADEKIAAALEGKTVRKVVFIRGRLVNIVVG